MAANFLTLSENGYFLAEILLKSVTFCDFDAQKEPIERRLGAILIQVYILWWSALISC